MTIFKLNFMFTLLTLIIMILLALALLTLVERKVIGSLQLRKGPNITYAYGLSQPIADGLKLFTKEPIAPLSAFSPLYMFSPIMALTISILLWLPLPMPFPLLDLNIGMLFLMALSSLAVYSVLGAGWASTSMYSLMGAMRVVAQNISYEVTLGLIVLSLIIFSGNYTIQTLSISQEHTWFIFSSWPLAFMWFISTLAETNRSPFDLVEGESELVSGFNTEYASAPFALFFLAEYANILLLSILSAIIFLGTKMYNKFPTFSSIILMAKAAFFSFMFLWIRATYPRFRYDQLMHLVWKNFLPITLAFMMWHISLPIASSGLPPQL